DHGERPDVWVGGTSFETARVFSVPASGSLTVPTTTVPIGPKVTGVVTDEAGQPINRTLVAIYRSDNEMSYQSWTHTNARGADTFASLQPGTYKLVFGDELGHYVGEWYEDQPDFASARSITVTSDVVVNAVLASAPVADGPHRVTGLVQNEDGRAQRASQVELFRLHRSRLPCLLALGLRGPVVRRQVRRAHRSHLRGPTGGNRDDRDDDGRPARIDRRRGQGTQEPERRGDRPRGRAVRRRRSARR